MSPSSIHVPTIGNFSPMVWAGDLYSEVGAFEVIKDAYCPDS